MTREVTSFMNMPVYTNKGIYVGEIKNVIIDTESSGVSTLVITGLNPLFCGEANDVGIPYRWISAIGDIIILSYFPDNIKVDQEESEEK